MRVRLEGIKFNHDSDITKTGAFNLRRNETQTVRVPEWQPDLPSTFEASPAAYAISILPSDITIQASFESGAGLKSPLLIQAIAEPPDHVLGNIEPFEIPSAGSSCFIPIKLSNARLSSSGIGIHDIVWRWQYSPKPNLWTDFQTTYHRIYTVLAPPSCPWKPESREASDIHQPWTEVLEFACSWASKVKSDPDEAATYITERFFELGNGLLKYQEGGYYTSATFACTEFLNLLRTRCGYKRVNCDDCATVISTFANILGCQLSQSSFGTDFYTNPILLIGAHEPERPNFGYHAVAWKGDAVNDELFDGCLQIDEDLLPPFMPVQPTDVPFGTTQGGYRFSVVRASPHVKPIPDHRDYGRRRRELGTGYFAQLRVTDEDVISTLKKLYGFDSWPRETDEELRKTESPKWLDVLLQGSFIPDWQLDSGEHFQDDRFPNVVQLLLRRSHFSKEELLALNVYECNGIANANNNLIEILGRFDVLKLKQLNEPRVGNLAFVNSGGEIVVFRRDRLLAVVRNAGRQQMPVTGFAQDLDHHLLEIIENLGKKSKGEK